MKKVSIGVSIGAAAAGFGLALAAAFAPIAQPDGAYLSSTTKVDFSSLDNFSTVTSAGDGSLLVSFSTEMSKRQVGVGGGGWAYWGSPPETESSTPAVLYTQGADVLTLVLSQPVAAFGFELEPNWPDTYHFTAEFRLGGVTVGSVTREIIGNRTALLFAAESSEGIDEVHITSDVPFGDFAIAQLRYRLAAASPGTAPTTVTLITPAGGSIKVSPGTMGMVTVTVETTAEFDALAIDADSAVFGPSAAHEAHGQGHASDADGDGDLDLVFHFRAGDTGLACGDTEATFSAMTFEGQAVAAVVPVSMKGCGKPK